MRLLQLDKAGRVRLVNVQTKNVPPYAILSHVWLRDEDEPTYKDIVNGTGQHKRGYQKLLFCGHVAKSENLDYFWVDTCAIDKNNSTEVQLSINSMFKWYQNASRCYVYMSDLVLHTPNGNVRPNWQAAFSSSRWFTRGWTLQELLAPKIVVFYSCESIRIGDKSTLESLISDTTGIAVKALRGAPLESFGVDERMSWAQRRETTIEEDAAYCLLGIFDVSMPLLQGEGHHNALRRLRKEIAYAQAEGGASASFGHNALVTSQFGQQQPSMQTYSSSHGYFHSDSSPSAQYHVNAPSKPLDAHYHQSSTPGRKDHKYIVVTGMDGSAKLSFMQHLYGPDWSPRMTINGCPGGTFKSDADTTVSMLLVDDGQLNTDKHAKVLKRLIASVIPSTGAPKRLDGIIILHDVQTKLPRMRWLEKHDTLQEVFGPHYLPHIVLATMGWHMSEPARLNAFEKKLIKESDAWAKMYDNGCPMVRLLETREAAMNAVGWAIRDQ